MHWVWGTEREHLLLPHLHFTAAILPLSEKNEVGTNLKSYLKDIKGKEHRHIMRQ